KKQSKLKKQTGFVNDVFGKGHLENYRTVSVATIIPFKTEEDIVLKAIQASKYAGAKGARGSGLRRASHILRIILEGVAISADTSCQNVHGVTNGKLLQKTQQSPSFEVVSKRLSSSNICNVFSADHTDSTAEPDAKIRFESDVQR
ncbi:hypothetical protein GN958_ATG08421, partial [Phytophthora infestans]